jgi:hypothetical protein
MDQKILILLGLLGLSLACLGVVAALPQGLIFVVPKMIFLILAVFFDVMAFASRYYTYLMVPLAKQRTKNVVISDQSPYWVSNNGDSIVRKETNDFIATVYVNIPLYISSSEMNEDEKLRFTSQVSRLVGLSKEPVRFTTELYLMNKDKYIQKLKDVITQIEGDEAKLVEANITGPQLEQTRGKLSMWKKMLDNISNESSFELGTFAAISARGSKEFEAISMAQQKAKELMNGIAATFGVPPNIVVGSELLKYIEPEYLIPYSTVTEQISRNIRQQV